MGIEIVLQDENCNNISEMVHDPDGVIALSLSSIDSGSCCLRFIDLYGDTIFNRLQAGAIIEEWDRLRNIFSERYEEELWAEVRKLIVRCSDEPHTYLKFIGD